MVTPSRKHDNRWLMLSLLSEWNEPTLLLTSEGRCGGGIASNLGFFRLGEVVLEVEEVPGSTVVADDPVLLQYSHKAAE